MTNRAPLKIIRNLEEALRLAKMERAAFSFTHEKLRIINGFDAGHVESIDSFVKERTRIYRETWLIPQIEEALAWARGD